MQDHTVEKTGSVGCVSPECSGGIATHDILTAKRLREIGMPRDLRQEARDRGRAVCTPCPLRSRGKKDCTSRLAGAHDAHSRLIRVRIVRMTKVSPIGL